MLPRMNGRDGARGSFKTIAILAAIPIAGLAAFFFWQWLNGGEPPAETYAEAKVLVERRASARRAENVGGLKPAAPQESPLPKVRRKPRRGSGDIVLIIDDL